MLQSDAPGWENIQRSMAKAVYFHGWDRFSIALGEPTRVAI
jgi:hypothetical protein